MVAGLAVLAAACSSVAGPPPVAPRATGATTTSPSAAATATTGSAPGSAGTADWATYFHDAGRSGVASGGPATAGAAHRQWVSPALDGDVYAQPLVVRDKVIAATENDTVYALNVTTGALVWRRHLGTPVPAGSLPCGDVDPVGVTSTPVVAAAAGRVYVVGLVQPIRHVLYSLDLASGTLVASVGVDGPGADPLTHNQRGALSLAGGNVLVPFGGRFGDCGEYHGRLAAVPATAPGFGTPAWYALPTGREGGFWAPPGPVLGGDGSIFITSGNSEGSGPYDYGNTVLHLSPGLKLLDSFAPSNWAALNASDSDLGSTNPVLVTANRVFQAGKSGLGYLLDAGHLGGLGGQLSQAPVCRGQAFGAVSHTGTTLFVPCPDGIAAVSVAGDRVTVAWRWGAATPGPAIVTAGAVWTVATGSGELIAADVATGHQIFSQPVGSVPSRFTSPAAGSGRVIVAADRKVLAFGD